MEFEFDAAKSELNRLKHGIDFEGAKRLWDDPRLCEAPARTIDEARFIVVGRIGTSHWAAIVTYRDERVRLISVRRARDEEIERYESP